MKRDQNEKIMYPHLPDGDRSGYGADFYHADRSYHQQFVYVGSGDHLQLWFHFPENGYRGKQYISQTVNLKFIPDMVTFSQYATVLFKSPDYLLKFWNSVILVVPIVVFQLVVAVLAAYGFTRTRGKLSAIVFFAYVILMMMPYQVTLVPNYLVLNWMKLLDTNWSIWLPGIFFHRLVCT